MAMKFLDMTGKTEEEAIRKALKELSLERDDVSVEILERAKSGFLGLGASPAKVRVTYGLEEPEHKPVIQAEPEHKPEPVQKQKAEGRPVESGKKPEAAKRPVRKPEQRPRQERVKQNPLQIHTMETTELPAEDLGELCTDAKSAEIRSFLQGLLEHLGSKAEIRVYRPEEGRYKVVLEGEKLGALIGRRGETLDAIQQLTNYSVNRGDDPRVRIHLDAENYRLKREQSLRHLADKVAAKVIKFKRNTTLEPMNSYERHIIHAALQDVEGVTTYSMGVEPNRRVIVAYDKNSGR